MLLDRIDIDTHGPLHRVDLGPFLQHLNAICGPDGSGKTALVRFLRDSLVNRDYPQGMLSSSTGRVVWADRNGLVHCRREQDGTQAGRRTIHFESRGDFEPAFGSLKHSWISGVSESTESSRAVQSIQLPESIVDGVITDAAVTSVARVVSACTRSGLDTPAAYRSIPPADHSIHHDRRFREELADVEAELARFDDLGIDHQTLLARRESLAARLARPSRSKPVTHRYDDSAQDNWQQRLTLLHDRARQLRARQNELRRWIADLDSGSHHDTRYESPARPPRYQRGGAGVDENQRRQLDDLDAQLIRWRRTLLEVRGLRNAFDSREGYFAAHTFATLDKASLRRLRLDGFLHAIDRYDRSRSWDDLYPETYRPLHRIDDIDHRIHSATRQIDWLLERYAGSGKTQCGWYESLPASANYRAANRRSAATLGETLRAVREDLRNVQRFTSRGPEQLAHRSAQELEEVLRCEQWLVAAIEQLHRHRDLLLHDRAASGGSEAKQESRDNQYVPFVFERERGENIAELERITSELDACLNQAADIRRSTRSLRGIESHWYNDPHEYDWIDRDALVAELHSIDRRINSTSHAERLRSRRTQLLQQLPIERRLSQSASPLADAASVWLLRLTAGRLRRIDWPLDHFQDNPNSYHRDSHHPTGVTINGLDETQCPAADRALSVMAVRMAAGDLLARTGRHVPLILETDREMFSNVETRPQYDVAPLADFQPGDRQAIATALADYSQSGRQVIVLTSNQEFAAQLAQLGARSFQIHAQRVVHAHRPIWRSRDNRQHYVGPHSVKKSVEINRDLDIAGHEAYVDGGNRNRNAPVSQRTDEARDDVKFRDGYFFANTYTTARPESPSTHERQAQRVPGNSNAGSSSTSRSDAHSSPFFLSVDSPIDQAPSIDAIAAARLCGLSVTHVTHLMQHDPNRLADALGLASVNAATIRRWQAECRLVCRVPHIRGFDARVLVGCGVTTPAELESIHPTDLLQEVEAFLATESGQHILLGGSSEELSRITTWIAAANSSSNSDLATLGLDRGNRDSRRSRRRIIRTMNQRDAESNSGGRSRERRKKADDRAGKRAIRRTRSANHFASRGEADRRVDNRTELQQRERRERRMTRERRVDREHQSPERVETDSERVLRFYLDRESLIVDAPSIGSRMAQRLNAIGIETVDDLLNCDPETVASGLDHRRVDADKVLAWQQQATLVCRVPMLRGHDAQLLVAAEVTTQEELAESTAEELFDVIDTIARSDDGRRIIRGGKMPDLAEVTDWIHCAQYTRELRAA